MCEAAHEAGNKLFPGGNIGDGEGVKGDAWIVED
jgi:hypothetical protein